jgi:hypothetical protein
VILIYVNLNNMFNLRRVCVTGPVQALDIVILDTRGEFIEVLSS